MRKIHIGDTVYFETLDGKIDSMVVHEIVRDKLFDENGAFLTKEEVIKITQSQPKQHSKQKKSQTRLLLGWKHNMAK